MSIYYYLKRYTVKCYGEKSPGKYNLDINKEMFPISALQSNLLQCSKRKKKRKKRINLTITSFTKIPKFSIATLGLPQQQLNIIMK